MLAAEAKKFCKNISETKTGKRASPTSKLEILSKNESALSSGFFLLDPTRIFKLLLSQPCFQLCNENLRLEINPFGLGRFPISKRASPYCTTAARIFCFLHVNFFLINFQGSVDFNNLELFRHAEFYELLRFRKGDLN